MKKREKKKGETGNWMDTYGDMVTLLLCFFVLLYSMSTLDSVKWRNFVKSMNPNAEDKVSQLVLDTDAPPDSEDVPGGSDLDKSADLEKIDEDFNSLYEDLQEMSKESGGDIPKDWKKYDVYGAVRLGGIGMNNKAEYTPEKVVDISNLSREDWLEYRKKGIGGSDVAAIMGISPFATIPASVYSNKTGVQPVIQEGRGKQLGCQGVIWLEDLVAEIFSKKTGLFTMIERTEAWWSYNRCRW